MALTDKLSAIGNAIRAKTGKTELLTLAQMPAEIESIETGSSLPDYDQVVVSGSDFEEWLLTAKYIDDNGTTHSGKIDYYNDWITDLRSGYCFSGFFARSITLPNLETYYSLRNGFFAYNAVVEEVYIPKLNKLPMNCFQGCTNLLTVDVSSVEQIQNNAFCDCYKITSIDLPVCKIVYGNVFQNCNKLTSINLPICEELGEKAFYQCGSLSSLKFPAVKELQANTFDSCSSLVSVDFSNLNSINGYSWSSPFYGCRTLETLILRGNSVVSAISNMSDLLNQTQIKSGGTGYIYVPKALLEDYKVATNWATLASQFRAIEDYPDICGQGG